MDFFIQYTDLVVYDWKELDIEKTEMVVLVKLGANDLCKTRGLTHR